MTIERYDAINGGVEPDINGEFVLLSDVQKCLENVAQAPYMNRVHILSRLEVLKEISKELGVPITTATQKIIDEIRDPC